MAADTVCAPVAPTTRSGMAPAMAAAVALHLAVAGGLVAWPHHPPQTEVETAVELVMVPPPPQPAPPPAETKPDSAPPPKAAPRALPPKPAPVHTRPRPVPSPPQTAEQSSATPAPGPEPLAASAPSPAVPAAPVPAAAVPADVEAAPVAMPRPHYPRQARQRGWEGVVTLRVEVSADGNPLAVTVHCSSGHAVLDEAAAAAAQQWRFRPAQHGGRGVTASVDVPVRFSLSEG